MKGKDNLSTRKITYPGFGIASLKGFALEIVLGSAGDHHKEQKHQEHEEQSKNFHSKWRWEERGIDITIYRDFWAPKSAILGHF